MSYSGKKSLWDPEGVTGLSALITGIYETVEDPSLWPAVLEEVAEATSGAQTLLFLTAPAPGQENALRCRQTPDEMLFPFLDYYATVNVLSEPCDRLFPDGTVRYSHWAVPDAVFEETEFYVDFFAPLDLHYSFGIKVPLVTGGELYMSVQRPKSGQAFDEGNGRVLDVLLPHLRRAVELQTRVRQAASQAETAESVLLRMGAVVMGLDEAGCLIYASEGAQSLLRQGRELRAVGGRLRAVGVRQNENLQRALAGALAMSPEFVGAAGQGVVLPKVHGDGTLRVTLLPRRDAERKGQVRLLVFVADSDARPASRRELLASLYGVTPTEGRVADLLLAGKEVKEIGEELRLTADTTRFYVKKLLSKTGTRRQAELVALMLSLPG